MSDRFYIDKTTGTFSDELLAAAFIRLLEQLYYQLGEAQPEIVQVDFGHYYEIRTTPALDLERVESETTPFILAPILRTIKNSKSLPDLPDTRLYVIDYEKEREKRSAFFAAYGNLEGTLKRAYAIGDDGNFPFDTMPPAPHERWNIFTLLNAPPMPINGYNKLMVQWIEVGNVGETGRVCRLLCDMFSQTPNDLAAAINNVWKPLAKPYKWTEKVTASQFLNPSQGKGVNKPLPNGVGLGNIKDFWLMEWLKAVGFYHTALTGRVKGADDRKTYVPAVRRAGLTAQRNVQERFKKKMRFGETAVRSDIFTIIRYVKAFIEREEAAQRKTVSGAEKALLALIGNVERPADFMRGFHTVFYKSLGTSAATMNISFLNLPGWIEIQQPQDVAIFQDILEEHESIVRQFAENKGEEIELLQLYRDFIVADNLDPFFEFTTAYSSWIISQGEGKVAFHHVD